MKIAACLLILILSGANIIAQPTSKEDDVKKKVTLSTGIEGNILQFAQVTLGALSYKTIPRYTYFFNTGVDIDFHAHRNLILFTGFQIKNIGIITAVSDTFRVKERVYTIGAPLGIKFRTNDKKFVMKFGADIALAFNYKRKDFRHKVKVAKFNEFFSDKANLMFSSVFAGVSYGGISVSGNYYLTNFYNPSTRPEFGRLFTVSLGLHIDENSLSPSGKKKNKQAPQ